MSLQAPLPVPTAAAERLQSPAAWPLLKRPARGGIALAAEQWVTFHAFRDTWGDLDAPLRPRYHRDLADTGNWKSHRAAAQGARDRVERLPTMGSGDQITTRSFDRAAVAQRPPRRPHPFYAAFEAKAAVAAGTPISSHGAHTWL